ncbi:MAG: hypothetical protein GXY32_04370 [Ruminococcaceae bacterium]|nr:hypothetical protein [Oscillospiraceae bacterium]
MYRGTGVSSGIGLAQARLWHNPVMFDYIPRKSAHSSNELARFEHARKDLLQKTDELRGRTALRVGEDEAAIFDAYHLILTDDEGLLAPLRDMISRQHFSAEYAVVTQFKALIRRFARLEDDYFRQRVEDLVALRDQLLTTLEGHIRTDLSHFDRPTIVVATILSPADVAGLDLSRLEGIVCESGSHSSHMSIIARTLGIPAVVGAAGIVNNIKSGELVALDGETGEIWVEPNQREIRMLHHRGDALARRRAVI